MTKYSKQSQDEVEKEMRAFKKGKAHSGPKRKPVKSRKQAIAIALSKARKKGEKVPDAPTKKKSSTTKKAGTQKRTAAKKRSSSKTTTTKKRSSTKTTTAKKGTAKKRTVAKKRGRPAKKAGTRGNR